MLFLAIRGGKFGTLHEWYVKHGEKLLQEMQKVFKDKAAGFTTLMEVIEEH